MDRTVDTVGIECRPEARDADYEVVAELVARLWLVYGVVPLYPHKHWANTACPGKWDLARLKSMATAKLSELKSGTTTTAPPAPAPTVPAPAPVQEDDMAVPLYSLWQNTQTGVLFRVGSDGQSKKTISLPVLATDQYFLTLNYGAPAAVLNQANTSALRAWLDSI